MLSKMEPRLGPPPNTGVSSSAEDPGNAGNPPNGLREPKKGLPPKIPGKPLEEESPRKGFLEPPEEVRMMMTGTPPTLSPSSPPKDGKPVLVFLGSISSTSDSGSEKRKKMSRKDFL